MFDNFYSKDPEWTDSPFFSGDCLRNKFESRNDLLTIRGGSGSRRKNETWHGSIGGSRGKEG